MIGLKQEDVWLLLSIPPKVLRQGEEAVSFAHRLKHLGKTSPQLCDRLFGICARLHFIEQLRQSDLTVIDDNDILRANMQAQYQLDRLITYMTATCIDVAAGKEKDFKLYPLWLRENLVTEKPGEKVASMIGALTASVSESETAEVLSKWTFDLFEDYLDEAGIARAFNRLYRK